MVKGRQFESWRFVSYGAEAMRYPTNRLEIRGNLFINHRRRPTIGLANYALGVIADVQDNGFERVLIRVLGRGRARTSRPAAEAVAEGPKD